uniref:Uncharacterized protein n=1 Tax=Globodera rostochiensis TaxID=31243 RepID=A0A914I6B1_GLORO
MAVVFILMLSSATLEAKQNDKFYDLMTAIGEHFGGEFNDAEKVLELDLNGANSFLDELHTFATREIVTKNENVAIYKDDKYKSEYRKGEAFKLSRKNYQILKQLNDQKFSIYEKNTANFLEFVISNTFGIDPELHFNSQDKEIQEYVQNDVEENCKKFDNEEAKILFLNNVRYDLAINFEFNQRKDVYERVEHLLIVWVYYAKFSKENN